MMRYIVPNDDRVRTIPLGRSGENNYTEIAFDISEWQSKYEIDALVLVMQRAQDSETEQYPAVVTIDGNYAVHILSATDLRDVGNGKCQLQMHSGDVVAKTKVFNTVCLYSLDGGGDTPAEWEPWMTHFGQLVARAETAADTATEKANIAIAAKDDAIEARDDAIEAAENARSEVTEAFGEITASATTLNPNESATASFNPSSKVMSFGIPKGPKGDPGRDGAPGTGATVVQTTGDATDKVMSQKAVTEEIGKYTLKSYTDKFLGLDLVNLFRPGSYSATGVWTDAQTQSQYTTTIINRANFSRIIITAPSGWLVNVARFNGNTFVSRGTWYTNNNPLAIDNTYDVAIIISRSVATSPIPVADMLAFYSIEGDAGIIGDKLNEAKKTVDFLYHIMNCDTNAKVLHFSFDDVISSLKAINTTNYASIFDHYFFGDLKELHDTYGCAFTLNCFCKGNDFDITQMTSRYASEFQSNKGWLRFSFHAEDLTANYNDASTYTVEPSTSYNNFVTGIYAMTGTYDTIDRFARLGFFGGTKGIVDSLRALPYGIIGLLCADDNRLSYYLTTEANNIVISKGKLFDDMVFLRSLPRIDIYDAETIISKITLPYQKYTEVFGHEYSASASTARKQVIADICEWASNHGYTYGYPSDIFA